MTIHPDLANSLCSRLILNKGLPNSGLQEKFRQNFLLEKLLEDMFKKVINKQGTCYFIPFHYPDTLHYCSATIKIGEYLSIS